MIFYLQNTVEQALDQFSGPDALVIEKPPSQDNSHQGSYDPSPRDILMTDPEPKSIEPKSSELSPRKNSIKPGILNRFVFPKTTFSLFFCFFFLLCLMVLVLQRLFNPASGRRRTSAGVPSSTPSSSGSPSPGVSPRGQSLSQSDIDSVLSSSPDRYNNSVVPSPTASPPRTSGSNSNNTNTSSVLSKSSSKVERLMAGERQVEDHFLCY
jgi:hypothetical protein